MAKQEEDNKDLAADKDALKNADGDEIEIVEGEDERPVTVEVKGKAAEDDRRGKTGGDDSIADGEEDSAADDAAKKELEAAGGDAEREEIRKRRREERARKAEERRLRDAARDQEIIRLRAQMSRFEQGQAATQDREVETYVSNLDSAYAQAQQHIADANEIRKQAIKEQNADAFSAADEAITQARERMRLIEARKGQVLTAIQQQQLQAQRAAQQHRTAQIAPDVQAHMRKFVSSHKDWYDPAGRNEESKIVLGIDSQLFEEGYKPNTVDYWNELNKRVANRLPHRVPKERGEDRGSPTGGSGRESGGGGVRYTLSPERVRALKEAGKWDDVGERNKMIRRYMDYDKQNRRSTA